ncbi:MAG TPA: hypothetical protein VJ833_10150 [Rhodanobacteraceae bacterium]|nr:hypothetical protein [Rhodanobacteraceae bacterium]
MEREIRRMVDEAATMEPALRLDALKLGVDWQKATAKRAANEKSASFFQDPPEDD